MQLFRCKSNRSRWFNSQKCVSFQRNKNAQVLKRENIGFPTPTSNINIFVDPSSILRQLHGQASKSSAKFADDRLQSSMSSKRACTQKCFLWTAQLCFATVLAPQSAGKNNILRRAQVGILTMQQIAMGRPPVCIRNQHVDTVVDFDSLFQNLVLHPTILLSSTGWRQLPPARSVANSIANQCHHGIYMSTRMCMRKHTKASVRIAYITFASVHLNCAFLGEKREKCALPVSQEQNSPKGISSSRSHCPLAEPGKLGSGS